MLKSMNFIFFGWKLINQQIYIYLARHDIYPTIVFFFNKKCMIKFIINETFLGLYMQDTINFNSTFIHLV